MLQRNQNECVQRDEKSECGEWEFWHGALVFCSRLQLAAPIGRSPFAALPLDPLDPSFGPGEGVWRAGVVSSHELHHDHQLIDLSCGLCSEM